MTITDISNSTILVTGASGFIGAHCVDKLLKSGYHVRAAVRSEGKFNQLAGCFDEEARSRLSPAYLSDIRNQEDVNKAVYGCEGILHVASPFSYSVKDFEKELLNPAIEGTRTVMNAAANEPRVTRVVITSSFAAVYDATKGLQPGVILDESSWSPLTWDDGVKTDQAAVAYRASKVLAEREAWNFIKQHDYHFDLVTLCPTMVFGPLVNPKTATSLESLNTSNQVLWSLCRGSLEDVPPTKGPVWVDVRDLADAHVKALQCAEASNQRFMMSAGDYDNQEISDILREKLPKDFSKNIPVGTPGARLSGTHFTTDSSKAEKVLGIKFRKLEDSVLDFASQVCTH